MTFTELLWVVICCGVSQAAMALIYVCATYKPKPRAETAITTYRKTKPWQSGIIPPDFNNEKATKPPPSSDLDN